MKGKSQKLVGKKQKAIMSVEDFQNEFRKRRLEAKLHKPSKDELKRMKKKQKVDPAENQNIQTPQKLPNPDFVEQQPEEEKIQEEGLPPDFFQTPKTPTFNNLNQTSQGENTNQNKNKQNKVMEQQQQEEAAKQLQQQQMPPPPKQIPKNFFDPTKEDRLKQQQDLKLLEQELNTYEKQYQEEQDIIAEQIQNQITQDEEQMVQKFEKEQRQLLTGGTVNQKLLELRDQNKHNTGKIPKRSKLMKSFVEIGGEEESSDEEFDDSVAWMGKTSVGFLNKKS
eukprot:TRINITY_DN23242_c0_g1_i5.p1 TRINITY_DN23242_c0_g1~~TRINITY_DN23242_c0_g1_i5.p1  ORF type:complete len:280 (-),score=78.11 TRINITY_DN23242_c0_g1_i5:553-1392(-)